MEPTGPARSGRPGSTKSGSSREAAGQTGFHFYLGQPAKLVRADAGCKLATVATSPAFIGVSCTDGDGVAARCNSRRISVLGPNAR